MKRSVFFLAIPVCLLQVQSAYANCADLGKQAVAGRSALNVAKDAWKSHAESLLAQTGKPSPQTIATSLATNRNMKRALDDWLNTLDRSLNAGCFGRDAAQWRDIIAKLRAESATMGNTIQMLLEMQTQTIKP